MTDDFRARAGWATLALCVPAFDREIQETLEAAAGAQSSGSAAAAFRAALNGTGEIVFSERTGIGARLDGCSAEGYRTVFGEPILGHEI